MIINTRYPTFTRDTKHTRVVAAHPDQQLQGEWSCVSTPPTPHLSCTSSAPEQTGPQVALSCNVLLARGPGKLLKVEN